MVQEGRGGDGKERLWEGGQDGRGVGASGYGRGVGMSKEEGTGRVVGRNVGTRTGLKRGEDGKWWGGKISGNEKGSEGGKWWGREEKWERKRE